jgi:hypothetical protein
MATFTITTASYDSDGYVQLQWESSQESGQFYSWRVYRRPAGSSTWKRIAEITSQTSGTYTYRDYIAPSNQEAEYAVVYVQVVSGNPSEGSYSPTQTVTPASSYYWVVHPDDSSLTLRLTQVTGDKFGYTYEEEEMLVIGRGRKVDRGESWGISGDLDFKFEGEGARERRLAFIELMEDGSWVWLRNPFGDVHKVVLFGGVDFDRMDGVGPRDFTTASVGYREVY